MKLKPAIAVAALLGCFLLSIGARAQVGKPESRSAQSDTSKPVNILNNDSYRYDATDTANPFQTLVGHVRLKQGTTTIECDSLIMHPKANYMDCFGNVHINDNDSVDIYSDHLNYQTAAKMLYFLSKVRLSDHKSVLTTETLIYDLNTHIGTYRQGGKIVSKESTLTSDSGVYHETTKDIHFYKNVILDDPQYHLTSDSLRYNTQTQVSTFITETFIQFKDSTRRTVRTREGTYDLKNKKAQFGKRPVMTDGSQKLTGDSVQMDDSTGLAIAVGNAIYTDTTQGIKLLANYMINDKKKNTFLATQRPLMILKQEKGDSLYVTADTLMSLRLVDFEAQQKILAYQDSLHRVYTDSIEKVQADSLHRSAIQRAIRDSIAARNAHLPADSLGGDSIHIKDLSDSLHAGTDSLHQGLDSLRKELDSTHRAPGDTSRISVDTTTGKINITPKKHLSPADSARAARPPTEKELHRQQRAKEKAARQAIRDSIADLKDKARDRADSLKARQKTIRDSLIIRQQDIADSIAEVKSRERARKRFIVDSTRQAAVNDSLRVVAHADSIRHSNFIDSLVRVGLVDSANAIRRQDSIKLAARMRRPPPRDTVEAPLPGHEADSIARLPTKDTTLRFVIGFHHVRIFSDSLQAVADSLYYSSKDSVFRLYYSPVAWGSGNYQISGDTMYVYTKNKKAQRLYVFENALAINKMTRQFYNQLKGTTINVFFKGGEIDYIRARGNSESIYYVQDEKKAFTGVNKAHADVIDMLFSPKYDSAGKPNGKELNRVVLRTDAEGTMYPIKHVNFDDMVLRGFKWQEDRRPKSKTELFEEVKRKVEEDFDDSGTPVTETPPAKPAAAPATAPPPAKPASATAQPPAKPATTSATPKH
jgi:lipopolysaccharide export system protein LptA